MKIELQNFKHSDWASEETDCFRADLWIDGKCQTTGMGAGIDTPTQPRAGFSTPRLRDCRRLFTK
jgi:hypothetical protein